jgi:cytochrome c peroxidase
LRKLRLICLALAAVFPAGGREAERPSAAVLRLGERLFGDDRFSTPRGDLPASCLTCHLRDQDPQGPRAHADFLARSWVPWRSNDPRRNELRNSPTLLDVGELDTLHFDGEFESLEALVRGTLAGRPMGWLPGEEGEALAQIASVLKRDAAYGEQFRAAFGVELQALDAEAVMQRVAGAVSAHVRRLRSARTSAYDRFAALNGLDAAPATGEDSKAFTRRLLARVRGLEDAGRLRFPGGFSSRELAGLKLFFASGGDATVARDDHSFSKDAMRHDRAGNCAVCHAPPLFTDNAFHNLGVSQAEYDALHGDGSFARLKIPDAADAKRPAAQFREIPDRRKPGCADLGYWNFADPEHSRWRRPGETPAAFLRRMIGAFKTPTLRNLGRTNPYLHNGIAPTLEETLEEMLRLNTLARQGALRAADEEFTAIRLAPEDLPAVVAFLDALNDRP